MAAKKYLDDTGLQYLIDNYIINKQIGTTKGDILYVSTSATSGSPGTVVYSRLGIGSAGQVLKVVSGVPAWANESSYTLPLAADGTRGGIQIGYTSSGKNYAVQLSSEKAYVNVPWTDHYVSRLYTSGLDIGEGKGDSDGVDLYVPYASNSQFGVVKTYYAAPSSDPTVESAQTTSGRYYGIQVDSNGKMFVNVPWSDSGDTNYYAISDSNSGLKIATGYSSGTASTTYDLYVPYASSTNIGAMKLILGVNEPTLSGLALSYSNGVATLLGPHFDADQFTIATPSGESYHTVTLNTITTSEIDAIFNPS